MELDDGGLPPGSAPGPCGPCPTCEGERARSNACVLPRATTTHTSAQWATSGDRATGFLLRAPEVYRYMRDVRRQMSQGPHSCGKHEW